MSPSKRTTDLLIDWSRGDAQALAELMPLVYDELRRLARHHLRRERREHTLQPTALVNEVYMRLVEQRRVDWQNRSQFFAFASTLMRRILVDSAKAHSAAKRGSGLKRVTLTEGLAESAAGDIDVLALDRALDQLAALDARQARIVEMRFFAGLSHKEIANALDTSTTTVKRGWRTAKLWLARELGATEQTPSTEAESARETSAETTEATPFSDPLGNARTEHADLSDEESLHVAEAHQNRS